jgi:hypothetical protein
MVTVKDAADMGVRTGVTIARANHAQLPKLGKEKFLQECVETESEHYRQFSPFEFYAKSFNQSPNSDKVWAAYENGVEVGIKRFIGKYEKTSGLTTKMIITIPPERKNPGKGAGIRQAEPWDRKAEWARRDGAKGQFRPHYVREKNLTKADATMFFRKHILPGVIRQHGKDDSSAIREAWNNFTDSLKKEGRISAQQYETWQNPIRKVR